MPVPPGPAAAQNAYVYTRTAAGVFAYRLNSDGSLSAVPGSPFNVPGTTLAAAGAHLFSIGQTQVVVYGIDPQTGALSSQSQAVVAGAGQISAADNFVYVTGTNTAGDFAVYAFSVALDGALTPVPGSPFFLSGVCDLCVSPESMVANAKYVIAGEGGGHNSSGAFTVFARQTDGSLLRTDGYGADSVIWLALNQAGTVVYAVQSSNDAVLVQSIDATGHLGMIQYQFQVANFSTVELDPAGPYLVEPTTPNNLDTYRLNPDGSLGTLASSTPTTSLDAFSRWVAFDATGRFLVLAEPGDLSIYSFNQTNGTMSKIGSTALSSPPGRPVVVNF